MRPEELTASTPKAGAACGACGHTSDTGAKFCASCGQSLFEPCGGCGKPVLLTQKFCGLCGRNLEQVMQQRLDEVHGWLAEAVESAKQHHYDRALRLLKRAAKPADYRFAEIAAHAEAAVDKVVALRERAEASAETLAKQAKAAFESDEKADAARFVQQIPAPLRSDESKQILANSIAFLGQESSLVNDLQASIKDQNWILAGGLLGQAIVLSPEDRQYNRLGPQVSDKLYKLSEKYYQKCHYKHALECLESVPARFHCDDHEARHEKIEDVYWLSQQFDKEAFATATLGRLAVRLSKEAPHDESAATLVKQLAAQVKQKAEMPRDPWSPWKVPRKSWCGGPAGFLAYPQSVRFARDSRVRKIPGRFNLAIGLAAQALGLGRIQQNLVESKGLLAGFGRRKKTSAWGIDIGSSGIRVVLLGRDEEGELVIEQDYHANFDVPTCRQGQPIESDETVRAALESMLEEIELGDAPVWVNLPASELVTRFVRLPPLPDKAAKSMLMQEAEQRIPLAIEDLRLVQWIADLGEDEVNGRWASVSAARKTVVEKRLELCTEAGLKVAGMQGDSLALVNFADIEFADLWPAAEAEDEDDEQEDDDSEGDDEQADQSQVSGVSNREVDSVLLLDAGAETTTLVIVSGEAFWFWNLETGGEALTAAIASGAKLVAAEADEKKINPSLLEHPGRQYRLVQQRQEELRGRLEKMVSEAKKQNERFKIVQSWCFGGACLNHAWIRRVLLPS